MGDDSLVRLAERLQAICLTRGISVATAESCTGGLIAHVLTEVSGSSGYVRGGIVAYADDVKRETLGVPGDALAAHGAVSAQVARAMAEGVRERLHADLGVSVTGIAGPLGGSEAKPVGLTYVGVSDGRGVEVRRFVWAGDRAANKRSSAQAALELLLAWVDAAERDTAGAPGAGSEDAMAESGAASDEATGAAPAATGGPER